MNGLSNQGNLSSEMPGERRRGLVRLFLEALAMALIVGLIITLFAVSFGEVGSPKETRSLFIGIGIITVAIGLTYAFYRYWSVEAAAFALLFLFIIAIVLSDSPVEVADGRNVFFFSIPIVLSSFILRRWASFVFAIICSITITIVGLGPAGQRFPNVMAMIGFFILATVAWLSARSLEEASWGRRVSEKRFRNVADMMPGAIFETDEELNLTYTNQNALNMFGYSEEDLKRGLNGFNMLAPKDRGKAKNELGKLVEEQEIGPGEFTAIRKDGSTFPVLLRAIPIWNEGNFSGLRGVIMDITDRKEAEEKVRKYSQHLEQLVEERTKQLKERERMAAIGETTAMVGHDLRNPLQVIVNNLYLAKNELDKGSLREVKDRLDTIEKRAGYMNKIVSDLQDYARPIRPELQSVDVHDFIMKVLDSVDVPDNVTVQTDIDPTPEGFEVDPHLIRRVLINLITNAFQAMPNGGELVISTSFDGRNVKMSVSDTGEGIPEEDMDRIFEPMFTTKAQGQGFGLCVCRKIAEGHGGTIDVRRKTRKGTKFMLVLPYDKQGTSDLSTSLVGDSV